jgi:hypothetical protein
MSEDLTKVFAGLLSQNRNRPDYGVDATMSADEPRIDLVMTFKSGSRYCCAEPGCHLSAFQAAFWTRLRLRLVEAGIADPPFPLTLHVKGIVEDGAILETLATLGVAEASPSYQYEEDYFELSAARDPHP